MKILWLSHLIPYPPKGGVLQRSYHLINELSRHHQVDLLAFNQHGLIGPLFKSVEAGVSEADKVLGDICRRHRFFEIPAEIRPGGKHWLALKSLVLAPYNINWLRSDEFARVVREWTADTQYDLIHFDTISLIPFLDCIPANAKTALDHHNIESHMLLRRAANESHLLKKAYFFYEGLRLQRYETRFCKKFDINITCSQVDTDRLRAISPGSNVATVPNGVDINYFKPVGVKTTTTPRLIFVGTMSWYPNIEAVNYIAEQLWPRLRQMFPTIEIDIVGANPSEKMRSLEQTHPGFRVHGFVDDVRVYFAGATVYLCPINDGGGTKLKILDAMAMKMPIVAHPIACEGIDVSNGTNVVFASSPEEYVAAIARLINDPDACSRIGNNARKLIEDKYSYESIGIALSTLYKEC